MSKREREKRKGDIATCLALRPAQGVSPAQVYNVKSTTAKPKVNGYASLIQVKKIADAMGGVGQAGQR